MVDRKFEQNQLIVNSGQHSGMKENAKLEQLKQICVVVDTNTFVYLTLLLRNPLGTALLFSLEYQGRLGMPEVLEQEIIKRGVSHAREMVEKINRNFECLQTIMGKEFDYSLPTEHDLRTSIENRLGELADKLVRVPFILDHAKSSLQRVMDESPPNGEKDQQFKDSAIWEAVLELSKSYDVHFITKDKGFYHQRDPKKGLASNLIKDCITVGGTITAHYELQSFLGTLKQSAPPINSHEVIARIDTEIKDDLRRYAAEINVELGKLIGSAARAFLTEDEDIVVTSFDQMNYEAFSKSPVVSAQADMLEVKGSCFFNYKLKTISGIDIEAITYREVTGKPVGSKSVTYLSGVTLANRRQTPFL